MSWKLQLLAAIIGSFLGKLVYSTWRGDALPLVEATVGLIGTIMTIGMWEFIKWSTGRL